MTNADHEGRDEAFVQYRDEYPDLRTNGVVHHAFMAGWDAAVSHAQGEVTHLGEEKDWLETVLKRVIDPHRNIDVPALTDKIFFTLTVEKEKLKRYYEANEAVERDRENDPLGAVRWRTLSRFIRARRALNPEGAD